MATYIIDVERLVGEQRANLIQILKTRSDRWAMLTQNSYAIVIKPSPRRLQDLLKSQGFEPESVSITPLRELLLKGDFRYKSLHWQAPESREAMAQYSQRHRVERAAQDPDEA